MRMTREELQAQRIAGYLEFGNTDLSEVNLQGIDMRGVKLSFANLSGARAPDVDFTNANLIGTNLKGAYLVNANLTYASVRQANMSGANLRYANFAYANMRGTKLDGADLCGAILSPAHTHGASFLGVKADSYTSGYWPVLPPGVVTVWKKVRGVIIELQVPADAKRSSATTRKCRVSHALVVGFSDERDTIHNKGVNYNLGKMVYPDSFDENRWNECSHGIHCFLTREEAETWET